MIENLKKQIDDAKKIIEVLPDNNKENRAKKAEYLAQEEMKSLALLTTINNELQIRTSKFDKILKNKNIANLEDELSKCSIIDDFSLFNTSYEKLHLDYYLYQLHIFYKNDLVSTNNCIRKIFDIFKSVGIELKETDFDYHPYVSKYLGMIQKNYSEEELKAAFEPLYWKLPILFLVIELNFRSIYLKYEKKINKYFETKLKEYQANHSIDKLVERKNSIIKLLDSTRRKDPYYIFTKFKNKEYTLNEFSENEIQKIKQTYFPTMEYTFDFLQEFYQVLYDYKLILKYNYLLSDLKETLRNIGKHKDVKSESLKKYAALEKEAKKLVNSGDSKLKIFKKKTDDDENIIKYKEVIGKLLEAYIALNRNSVFDNIYKNFPINATVADALKLMSLNYLSFISQTMEVDENKDIEYLNNKYQELKDEVNNNVFVLLYKLDLLDEYQLKQVIVDKYVLDGVKLTIEQIEADNIDKTLKDINTLINYEYILKSGLKIEDIKLYFDVINLKDQ